MQLFERKENLNRQGEALMYLVVARGSKFPRVPGREGVAKLPLLGRIPPSPLNTRATFLLLCFS